MGTLQSPVVQIKEVTRKQIEIYICIRWYHVFHVSVHAYWRLFNGKITNSCSRSPTQKHVTSDRSCTGIIFWRILPAALWTVFLKKRIKWHDDDCICWICDGDLSLVVGALLAIGIATYGLFLILAIPIAFVYFKLYQLVSHTSISAEIGSNFRSPLYAAFSEVLNGVETIRAFGQSRRFMTVHRDMLNRQMLPFFGPNVCWSMDGYAMQCSRRSNSSGNACIAVGFLIYSQQVW